MVNETNAQRNGEFENMKMTRGDEKKERQDKKEDAKGQSGRRVLKDQSDRKRDRKSISQNGFFCVYTCISTI